MVCTRTRTSLRLSNRGIISRHAVLACQPEHGYVTLVRRTAIGGGLATGANASSTGETAAAAALLAAASPSAATKPARRSGTRPYLSQRATKASGDSASGLTPPGRSSSSSPAPAPPAAAAVAALSSALMAWASSKKEAHRASKAAPPTLEASVGAKAPSSARKSCR